MRPKIHTKILTETQLRFRDTFSNPKVANLLFSKVSPFEEQWQKEVTSFSKIEALTFLKSLNSLSIQSLNVYAWTMRKYSQFCGVKHSAWAKISQTECESLINAEQRRRKYLSESDVKALSAVLFNPVDRFILRGFYEGLAGDFYEDFKDIYPESFDELSSTVRLANGVTKQISHELYELAIESAETYTYSVVGDRDCERNLYDWSKGKRDIVKLTYGSHESPAPSTWKRKIRNRLDSIREYFCIPYLTIPNIRNSGVYNHLVRLSLENNCSIRKAVYLDEFKDIAIQYNLNLERLDKLSYRFSREEYE